MSKSHNCLIFVFVYNLSEQIKEVVFMENNAGKKYEIPIWHKANLTVDEAASYTGIGRDKLRSISNRADCPFVLWIGNKRLLKRKKLEEYINQRDFL